MGSSEDSVTGEMPGASYYLLTGSSGGGSSDTDSQSSGINLDDLSDVQPRVTTQSGMLLSLAYYAEKYRDNISEFTSAVATVMAASGLVIENLKAYDPSWDPHNDFAIIPISLAGGTALYCSHKAAQALAEKFPQLQFLPKVTGGILEYGTQAAFVKTSCNLVGLDPIATTAAALSTAGVELAVDKWVTSPQDILQRATILAAGATKGAANAAGISALIYDSEITDNAAVIMLPMVIAGLVNLAATECQIRAEKAKANGHPETAEKYIKAQVVLESANGLTNDASTIATTMDLINLAYVAWHVDEDSKQSSSADSSTAFDTSVALTTAMSAVQLAAIAITTHQKYQSITASQEADEENQLGNNERTPLLGRQQDGSVSDYCGVAAEGSNSLMQGDRDDDDVFYDAEDGHFAAEETDDDAEYQDCSDDEATESHDALGTGDQHDESATTSTQTDTSNSFKTAKAELQGIKRSQSSPALLENHDDDNDNDEDQDRSLTSSGP